MKPLNLLALPLLIATLGAVCQDKLTDRDAPDYYKRGNLAMAPLPGKQAFPFPADSIEMIDLRQDTSKFGFYHATDGTFAATKFCFKKKTSTEITSFLNGAFNNNRPPTGHKLLYCLKKLWIVSADTIDMEQPKWLVTRSKLYLKAELYFEKDSCYYPLYRFDSVFIYPKTPAASSVQWVAEALIQSLDRLKSLTPERVIKRTCMRPDEINSYYAEEKRTALSQAGQPKKGVYLTIDQFKNNQPAFTDFEVSFGKLVDVIQVKDKEGHSTPTNKDWGFCNGEECYIRLGQNYFRLFKTGDTYDLVGTPNDPVNSYGGSLIYNPGTTGRDNIVSEIRSANLRSARKNLSKARPLQVDMETGRVY